MGAMLSGQVPAPDERMLEMIAKLKLKEKDLRVLYRRFSRYDQECLPQLPFNHSDALHLRCSPLSTDEDNSGVLDFSEYVEALGKFCILSKDDILKCTRFCFNVFDTDKNGTIEGEELTHLLEILHADDQTSNMKLALQSFDFNGDGKIDFGEFQQLNTQFPSLFYPAFRIQQNMRIFTLGQSWWERKIDELLIERNERLAQLAAANVDDMNDEALRAQREEMERRAKLKRQEQAVRIRMGCLYYACCPCRRQLYLIEDDAPNASDSEDDSDEERERRKKKQPTSAAKKGDGKKQNIVAVGPRKPLSQEERLERARKRRLRDMQDRPTRKD
ncbi:hypothetical protein BBJ28_00024781 [Nothophytophthora sp. Chile5]|nr:hypothetical protein BBJ28_00024781 [Nothophytophthora sp. Chile5]